MNERPPVVAVQFGTLIDLKGNEVYVVEDLDYAKDFAVKIVCEVPNSIDISSACLNTTQARELITALEEYLAFAGEAGDEE